MSQLIRGLFCMTLLLLSLTSVSPMPLMALKSDLGSISGVVRDGDGKGVSGALVSLTSHSAAGGAAHATSGPTGEYRFTGLSEGEYSVGAEMAGYISGGNHIIQLTQESNTATADLVLIRGSAKAE